MSNARTWFPCFAKARASKLRSSWVDRATSDVIGMSLWETEEDMLASEAKVRPVRHRVAQQVGASAAPDVRIYEVPVFELA